MAKVPQAASASGLVTCVERSALSRDLTRRIFAAPALARHSVEEITPGPGVSTPEALTDYIRKQGTTIYHIVGICKMGEDPTAVVDSRLRVRGLSGLRVIDASIMPAVTTANTNAPTIVIAKKGASMIRQDTAGDLLTPLDS
jgi:choline dehydrogenase